MPPQQSGRLEHESVSRQIGAECGEDGAIGGEEVRSGRLTRRRRTATP
jgi:hypothetical protein